MERTRLLIVDQCELVVRALERALKRHYDLETALTGREAVSALENHAFDILLSDLHLEDPVPTSKLLEHARELQPKITRVVMAGDDFSVVNRLMGSGRAELGLQKPWEYPDLLELLAQAEAMRTSVRASSMAGVSACAVNP